MLAVENIFTRLWVWQGNASYKMLMLKRNSVYARLKQVTWIMVVIRNESSHPDLGVPSQTHGFLRIQEGSSIIRLGGEKGCQRATRGIPVLL